MRCVVFVGVETQMEDEGPFGDPFAISGPGVLASES